MLVSEKRVYFYKKKMDIFVKYLNETIGGSLNLIIFQSGSKLSPMPKIRSLPSSCLDPEGAKQNKSLISLMEISSKF